MFMKELHAHYCMPYGCPNPSFNMHQAQNATLVKIISLLNKNLLSLKMTKAQKVTLLKLKSFNFK